VFCIYLRTHSELCHLQHKLIGFYNRDEKCLQRGTDWVFKYSGLRFVFKGLNLRNVRMMDTAASRTARTARRSIAARLPTIVPGPSPQYHNYYKM
jgi:hypothetical protein